MDKIKIAITTGDEDGIGLEVTVKALKKISLNTNVQFFIFRSSFDSEPLIRSLKNKYSIKSIQEEEDVFSEIDSDSNDDIIDIRSKKPPASWVETATRLCLSHQFNGLTTGPLSKPSIKESGLSDIGHTDILKRLSGVQTAYMGFLGRHFNVVLATGHIPLTKVSPVLNRELLFDALFNAQKLVAMMPKKQSSLPIGLLALNPHGGDKGLIGNEEESLFSQSNLNILAQRGINIRGPLVPDAAFLKEKWSQYSTYVALYHDQGLIPFKMAHQHSGCQVTLGIPFIRTSVDHGTAKDLFNKNKANPNSMLESLQWCIKLAKARAVL